ncbi:MAG TPA: class II fructose-bisphosphatase [Trueperaceae bacterium]|nr:class II fructose-bisphosphatase [Trueperaceae bacterium]
MATSKGKATETEAKSGGETVTKPDGRTAKAPRQRSRRDSARVDLERALVLDTVRVTEQAAIAASRVAGKGDADLVDQAGTDAMRRVLNELDIAGEIVIGEGERDEAPMLYIGEKLGRAEDGAYPVDIAVDPVEGTNITARMINNSVAVIALAEQGGLFRAPDTYMEKLVVGPPAAGTVDLSWPVAANLRSVALSLDRAVDDLTVVILDRPRHEKLIADVREAGARVKLIGDGDVIAALSAAVRGTGVHAVMGVGGAPEGVLAAAALKCLGGEIQGRFKPRSEEEKRRLEGMGATVDRIYKTDDLAPGKTIVFSATGITDGDLLRGVKFFKNGARTHSVTMGLESRVIRFSDAVHLLGDGARVTIQV